MGTDASGLDQLELGCHSLGAEGNERFGEFGEGVLTRKKNHESFYLSMGKQQSLPGSFQSQYLRNQCPGGEPLFFFCTEGRTTGGRLGVGKRGWVCFGRASSVITDSCTQLCSLQNAFTRTDFPSYQATQAG